MRSVIVLIFLIGAVAVAALSQGNAAFELARTRELLGVDVRHIPSAEGVATFDELPREAAPFKFKLTERPLTGPTPSPSYETRSIVEARAPDGIVYKAYCGRYGSGSLIGSLGASSTNANPRQMYAPHLGYGYNPADIFIGRGVGDKIKTALFFRDVGSHTTAPHYISVDSSGNVHLIVSDVNISDGNELNVYSMIGNPVTGKWTDAVMLDRRGFTSWSHPWAGSWRDGVHSLWDWSDASYDKKNPNMGLFYVAWGPSGYGKKVRAVSGLIESYAAAIDPASGTLVVVAVNNIGTFVLSRDAAGVWTSPTELVAGAGASSDEVSIQATTGGAFVVRRAGSPRGREWLLQPTVGRN